MSDRDPGNLLGMAVSAWSVTTSLMMVFWLASAYMEGQIGCVIALSLLLLLGGWLGASLFAIVYFFNRG